ncbi:MAG TPA: hypothetical protein VIK01_26705 [Polyangiaceae bacterium]
MQQRREIQATARALEQLAGSMGEAGGAGDFEQLAIDSFRASLAVLSLRGMADRLAVATAEQDRLQRVVIRAAYSVHPMLAGRGADALSEAFDFWFPLARLDDLNLSREQALRWFVTATAELRS